MAGRLIAANVALLTLLFVILSFIHDIYYPEAPRGASTASHGATPINGSLEIEDVEYALLQVNDTYQAHFLLQDCSAERAVVNFTAVHVLTGEEYAAAYVVRGNAWSTPVFRAGRSGVYRLQARVALEGVSGGPCDVTVRHLTNQSRREAYLGSYVQLALLIASTILVVDSYALLRRK
ncbi:hypothetical protein IG193_08895 [Infirmifilum lucidum]|uniref:Uncharacterized protein n=1 Tax=Infirmifilum lucidum TaxID=2776706 RepID=A0A7L9FIX3_9CREN|nr:hypothetical protein [Infirmifilum lucidum]QOJ78846.1 hypothetical protein IG193_08895 [Infirmifilum lucidum]